ncbi:MAG: prenyltransferase/squalene oxidase repeat-containing protein [Verrucomicrobiota bacterium]
MKKNSVFLSILLLAALPAHADKYESIRQEIRQAIARGNDFLAAKQHPDGHWDDAQLPAITALAVSAAARDPRHTSQPLPANIRKGYGWLLAQQKPDGGIYNRGLSVYNTAISVTALMAGPYKEHEPAIIKARKHLIDNQWDHGKKQETDEPGDGGVGYGAGSDKPHNDLSNTYLAIEALALSKKLIDDGKFGGQPDLDWQAAITFVSRCQNLEKTNDREWASDDPKNKGGFVYNTKDSKAGEEKTPEGRTALRSYGSMSYAGLLSLVYAKVSASDPRVEAVKEWLTKNYTVAENPGMGDQGLYYYFHVMAKALTAANVNDLRLASGKQRDWRSDLADAILSKQKGDGSWINSNGRWMESNPILVTAYSVLALEQILASIPAG